MGLVGRCNLFHSCQYIHSAGSRNHFSNLICVLRQLRSRTDVDELIAFALEIGQHGVEFFRFVGIYVRCQFEHHLRFELAN